ncbi:hypothetical protein E4T42_01576 [Aureobasidium subglaciale]|nr:hypothetical protein E4T42_01576 [Aureobasidium subglaciale]
MIGVGTAIADDPSLNCRVQGVGGYGGEGLTGQPQPVVVDPHGRWQLTSKTKILNLAREGRGKAPWILTLQTPSVENVKLLEQVGGCYIVLNTPTSTSEKPTMAWLDMLQAVKDRGVESIMIEGGGVIINSLLAADNADLIDSVIVTIAPTWLGLFENDKDIRIVRDFSYERGVGGTTAMLLYPTDLLAQRERLDDGVANRIFKKHLPCDDVLDRTLIDNGTNQNARNPAAYKLSAGDNDYPQEACGHCGKEKSDDGAPCHPCSQCGHRHYCSRKCELAHRPKHKLVCDDPFYKVVSNLVAKSQNQARDADSDMRSGSDVGQARLSGSSTPATKFPDGPLTCGNCDASSTEQQPLSMCQKCRRQYYCIKKCQKAHWSSHKKLCLARTMI